MKHPYPWLGPVAGALALGVWAAVVQQSGRWPAGDGPHVLGASMRLASELRAGEFSTFARAFQTLLAPHPPGAYVPWTLSYLLLGPGRWGHLLASAGLVALCADAVRRLGGGLSGVLWLVAPALLWAQAEAGGVDLVAATCAAQSISWLAASDRLQRRGPAAAWGAWMGAGFLSKYTFPMFLWAPCALAGLWVVRGQRWPNLLAAILAFLAVAGLWYGAHTGDVLAYLGASMAPDPALVAARDLAKGPWYSSENLGWYPAAALDAWGWVGALALGIGVLLPRRRDVLPDGRVLVGLAVLGAGLLLAQSVQRQDRYLLPAFPLIAAVAGGGRRARALLPVALVGLSATALTFSRAEAVPSTRHFGHALASAGRDWPWPAEAYRPVSQDPAPWRVDAALDALANEQGRADGTVGLLLDDQGGVPGMGAYLFGAACRGLRWDLATVSVAPDGAGGLRVLTFVGPFATDSWPSREFRVLYSAFRPGDASRERWLEATGIAPSSRWPLPEGYEGRIYVAGAGERSFSAETH